MRSKKYLGNGLFGVLVVLSFCVLILNRGTVKETTIWQCYEYVASGQAADFQFQMEESKAVLLDESIKEVYLPPINDVQGPLMHMPVGSDETVFTNRVTKEFYRKDAVHLKGE